MPVPDMHFGSLGELWHMAGHGPFVWSAYAIVFVVTVALIGNARTRSRDVLRRVRSRTASIRQSDPQEL